MTCENCRACTSDPEMFGYRRVLGRILCGRCVLRFPTWMRNSV